MKYKNLLALHALHDPMTSLKSSIAIAQDFRAKLEIHVVNQAMPVGAMVSMEFPNYDWYTSIAENVQKTEERVVELQAWLQNKQIDATVTSSCQQLGLIDKAVSVPALYADLVLYHRCDQSLTSGSMSKALEGALFDAGKPALVLTDRSDVIGSEFKSITIAWDPVPQAMKALTASLPILTRATRVSIVIANNDVVDQTSETELQHDSILDWLENHGVTATIKHIAKNDRSVSETLLHHINSSSTDLIVMGAYGHTRLSERMFSGVSRSVLKDSNKSLFIAH